VTTAHALLKATVMRPRTLIVDTRSAARVPAPEESETYEHVRRTLDDALAELELEIDLEEGREPTRRLSLR
jgi:hypothetical protein